MAKNKLCLLPLLVLVVLAFNVCYATYNFIGINGFNDNVDPYESNWSDDESIDEEGKIIDVYEMYSHINPFLHDYLGILGEPYYSTTYSPIEIRVIDGNMDFDTFRLRPDTIEALLNSLEKSYNYSVFAKVSYNQYELLKSIDFYCDTIISIRPHRYPSNGFLLSYDQYLSYKKLLESYKEKVNEDDLTLYFKCINYLEWSRTYHHPWHMYGDDECATDDSIRCVLSKLKNRVVYGINDTTKCCDGYSIFKDIISTNEKKIQRLEWAMPIWKSPYKEPYFPTIEELLQYQKLLDSLKNSPINN